MARGRVTGVMDPDPDGTLREATVTSHRKPESVILCQKLQL